MKVESNAISASAAVLVAAAAASAFVVGAGEHDDWWLMCLVAVKCGLQWSEEERLLMFGGGVGW